MYVRVLFFTGQIHVSNCNNMMMAYAINEGMVMIVDAFLKQVGPFAEAIYQA